MNLNEPCRLTDKQVKLFKVNKLINNEYICETAGFVPLEVKFKKFEQAGIRQQINASDYTSSDYRDMYLNPDYQVYPEDEIEEVEEKYKALQAHILDVKKNAAARTAARSEAPKIDSGAAAPAVETKQSPSVDTEE